MKKVLEFDNQHDSEVQLDLEPYPEIFMIPPGRIMNLYSDNANEYLRICIGLSEAGHPQLSVWPPHSDLEVSLKLKDE